MNQPSRVALVTGSSRGIGRAIVEQLSADDFSVVINYARNAAAANEIVDKLEQQGGRAVAVQGDVASRSDRQRLVDSAYETWGRLDLLVNNAGITSVGRNDLLDATEESWDTVLGTNLKGPFFLSQYAAKRMAHQTAAGEVSQAQIVNISSISAFAVSTNRADYCIAKAGMSMMTRLFASRLAEENIGVFEISPGVIETDMTEGVKEKYDRQIADGLSPIRRWGRPEDVALAVSTIASGKFPFSTGDTFHVDGGFHIRRL